MRYRLVPAARVLQPVLAGREGPVPCRSLPRAPIWGADATVQGGVLVANVVPASREGGRFVVSFSFEGLLLDGIPSKVAGVGNTGTNGIG